MELMSRDNLPIKDLSRQVQGRLVPNIWEPISWIVNRIWYSDQFGAFKYYRGYTSENIHGMLFVCPGCGEVSCLPFISDNPKHDKWIPGGTILKPHLRPSILSAPAKGGCGWHGFLNHGYFELSPRE